MQIVQTRTDGKEYYYISMILYQLCSEGVRAVTSRISSYSYQLV